MSLYVIDKPMQNPDFHGGLIDSVSTEAMFLGLLPNGPKPKNFADEWAVKAFPVTRNPVAGEGNDKTTGWSKAIPLTLKGMTQLNESVGYLVTEESEMIDAGYETGNTLAEQRVQDASNFALQHEKVFLSNQEARDKDGDNERLTRGAFRWLQTTAHDFQDIPAALRPTSAQWYAGTLALYDEDAFKAQLRAAAEQQKKAVSLFGYVGLALKDKMSKFAYRVTKTDTVSDARLIQLKPNELSLTVDLFEYDGGKVRTVWMPRLLCDTSDANMAETAYTPNSGLFLDLTKRRARFPQERGASRVPEPERPVRGVHERLEGGGMKDGFVISSPAAAAHIPRASRPQRVEEA